jgi:bacteriocin biosynthesis cyclodehydratase domain-containing protein
MALDPRLRVRLALPFTVLSEDGIVRLVAGEEFRYTLSAPGLDTWLPLLLGAANGAIPISELVGRVAQCHREDAYAAVERLLGERVLVEGSAIDEHIAASFAIRPEGEGAIREILERLPASESVTRTIPIYCQERLDYAAALSFNAKRLAEGTPWMWTTTGPMGRGFVSPAFVPHSGPCLACLLAQFERLSPAPELYGALVAHANAGRRIEPVPFPSEGVAILAHLVRWKVDLLARDEPNAAAYRLHVLEVASLEVTSHSVMANAECGACCPPTR